MRCLAPPPSTRRPSSYANIRTNSFSTFQKYQQKQSRSTQHQFYHIRFSRLHIKSHIRVSKQPYDQIPRCSFSLASTRILTNGRIHASLVYVHRTYSSSICVRTSSNIPSLPWTGASDGKKHLPNQKAIIVTRVPTCTWIRPYETSLTITIVQAT